VLQWQPYVLIPVTGAVICAFVGWSAWRRRRSTPAAAALAVIMLGLVEWAMAEVIGSSFTSLRAQAAVGLAIFPGVAVAVLGAFWLSRVVVDREATLRPVVKALLLVEPIAITVAAATNNWHHLVFTSERLQADLSQQAIRDDLTGLYNRRHLMRTLEGELAHARETGRPLSVVLLDIDYFKSVNDRFGHGVGDELLVAIAEALCSSVRQDDTVARYGGEEFVVLLPGVSQDQARNRAQDWRRRCAAASVSTAEGPLSVTFSAGVACFPDSGTSSVVLLNAADKALYRAKAEGRDRVLLAESIVA
jgi:diguanylate cyclase (GGDEF)-like protein